jgi:lysophospholipase L1-like esterase
VALAATVGSAIVAVTCSAGRQAPPAEPPPSSPAEHAAPAAVEAPTAAPAASPVLASAAASAAPPIDVGELTRLSATPPATEAPTGPVSRLALALGKLQRRELDRHVRILWLGDSHAAADYWTGALRSGLQKRFGSGGPGYVYAGYKGYRHDGIDLEIEGKWAMRPKGPATTKASGDGVFGLGGVLLRGFADEPRVRLKLSDSSLTGDVGVDVCVKVAPGDELEVTIADGVDTRRSKIAAPRGTTTAGIVHEGMRAKPKATITLKPGAGRPELCGVVVENDPAAAPGVVLDTLGINGARYGTALAWNEAAWTTEVARRRPDLVIMEYGTNEASDVDVKPAAIARNLAKLLARVRRAAPDADCAVVSPTDRADRESTIGPLRDALREGAVAGGCWFFDAYEAMGGRGSMAKWRDEDPPRGAKDGIHLTAKGYRDLGNQMFAKLLDQLR